MAIRSLKGSPSANGQQMPRPSRSITAWLMSRADSWSNISWTTEVFPTPTGPLTISTCTRARVISVVPSVCVIPADRAKAILWSRSPHRSRVQAGEIADLEAESVESSLAELEVEVDDGRVT